MNTVLFVCTHNASRSQMAEIGVDISGHTSDHVDPYTGGSIDGVVTVCDDAVERCPFIPARTKNLHRGFEDPSAVTGTDDEKRAAFRQIRDELADWIDATFGTDGDLHSGT